MLGPAKLPAAELRRLHDAVVAASADPEVRAVMALQENMINPSTPEAAARFMRNE